MSTEEKSIPLKISYTDADVADAAKRDRWAEGTYRAILADIKRDVSKDNGHLMFVNTYRVLRDPEDAGSVYGFGIKHWQCLPFRNPEREGHTPKKFFSRSTNDWLAAHLPEEIKALPRKTDDGLMYDGEVIEAGDEEEKKREAYDLSFAKASSMWEDESGEEMQGLTGSAVYFDLYYGKDKETGIVSDFPSLTNFRAELEAGAELVDPAIALSGAMAPVEEEEESVVEEPAKKAANKAKAKPVNKVTPIKKAAVGGKRR